MGIKDMFNGPDSDDVDSIVGFFSSTAGIITVGVIALLIVGGFVFGSLS